MVESLSIARRRSMAYHEEIANGRESKRHLTTLDGAYFARIVETAVIAQATARALAATSGTRSVARKRRLVSFGCRGERGRLLEARRKPKRARQK